MQGYQNGMGDGMRDGIGLRQRVAELARDPNAKAIAIGAAAVVITPIVLPYAKPLLRGTLKSGVVFFEKTRGAIAEAGEIFADIAAEARAEVHGTSPAALSASVSRPDSGSSNTEEAESA
ncbi:MAG: DUF5132 domain-containing protein [Phormidium sp.]|nr:MAG: hypothetical protein HLUCCO16_10550 [Phormidium sp. OSCR]